MKDIASAINYLALMVILAGFISTCSGPSMNETNKHLKDIAIELRELNSHLIEKETLNEH